MNSSIKIDECLGEDERIIINEVILPIGEYSVKRIIGRNKYSEFVEYVLLYNDRIITSLIRKYDDLWQLYITLPDEITPSISDVPKFWHLNRAMRETENILPLIIHGEFSKSKPYQDLIRQQKIEFERVNTDIPFNGPEILIEESVFGNSKFKKFHVKNLTGEWLRFFDLRWGIDTEGNSTVPSIGHAVRFYGSDGWELCFVTGFYPNTDSTSINNTGLIVNTIEEAARLLEYFIWEECRDDIPFYRTQRYLEYRKKQKQSYRGYNGHYSCYHYFRLTDIGREDLYETLPAEPWVGPDKDYVVEVIFRKFIIPYHCPSYLDKRLIDFVVVKPYVEDDHRNRTIMCYDIEADHFSTTMEVIKKETIPVPEEEYPFIKSQLEKEYSKMYWNSRLINIKTKIIRWEDIDWERHFAQFNISPEKLETYKFEKLIQELSNE